MDENAVYVIVKYVDDLERNEPLNVGALLGTQSGIWHKFVDREDQRVNAQAVQRFEELVRDLAGREARGDTGYMDGSGFLLELADRSFSHFLMTEPRQVTIKGDPEEALASICQRLVMDALATRR
jgi:hypothetical protein